MPPFLWLLLCLFVHLINAQTLLNATLRLSSYQTSAYNVTLYIFFSPRWNIPPNGTLVVTTYGTTSIPPVPPVGGIKTPARIMCGAIPAPYTRVPDCQQLFFPPTVDEDPSSAIYSSIGPYTIAFPNGLRAGPYYLLPLGGLYNQAAEGTAYPSLVWTTNSSNFRLEAQFESSQFTYATFRAEFRLDTYLASSTGATLTVYFFAGQITDEGTPYIYILLSSLSGQGTLNCSRLWNSSAIPLPNCTTMSRMVANGNPYKISVDTLWPQRMYSFSISGLTLGDIAGPTGTHLIQLMYGDVPFNSYVVDPFIFYDLQAPSFIDCPSGIVVSTAAGRNYANVSWKAPTAVDNVGIANVTSTFSPGTKFPFGITQVTYTTWDTSLNSATCSFSVRVVDTEPPQLSCPSKMTVNTAPGLPTAIVTWPQPTVTDNVDPSPSVRVSRPSGSPFRVGRTVVQYNATDSSGNLYSCNFSVVVVDNQPPVLQCSGDITANMDTGRTTAVVTWDNPIITDNVGVVRSNSSVPSGYAFPAGITVVTYTAFDAAGNVGRCTFYVTIFDSEAPQIACPSDVSIPTSPGMMTSQAFWSDPVAIDNVRVAMVNSTHASGDIFTVGITRVTYVATDEVGNENSCTFLVIVRDTEPPHLTCPSNFTQNMGTGVNYATVVWPPPSVTDNVAVASGPNCNPASGSAIFAGLNTITCTATDTSGNVGSCTFVIFVIDDEPPVIQCPNDVVQSTDFRRPDAVVRWSDPIATDNAVTPVLRSTMANGAVFPLGTTWVYYTASDGQNVATCSFSVTIEDHESPQLRCPNNIIQSTLTGQNYTRVSWAIPNATDNVGLTGPVVGDHVPLSIFYAGVTYVTYRVQDTQGNNAQCMFSITIMDPEAPQLSCPGNIVQSTDKDRIDAVVFWPLPNITDNVGVVRTYSTAVPGSVFPLGNTTVTYMAWDGDNNRGTCSFVVSILDLEKPTIICPYSWILKNEPGQNFLFVTWTEPTEGNGVSDNVGILSVVSDHSPGPFAVGTTIVTYTATDLSGNVQTCSFAITIVDTENPLLSCPTNIVKPTDPGQRATRVYWPAPSASDNVGIVVYKTTRVSGSYFKLGTTTVSHVVRDRELNTVNCTWNVTVVDQELPTITCPADIRILLNSTQNGTMVQWPVVIADDNDKVASLTSNRRSGDIFIGHNYVTYVATDPSGNIANCSFWVIVSKFYPNATISTPRTDAPSNVTVTFQPEVDVPPTGTIELRLPYFSGNGSLVCMAPGGTMMPGCAGGPIGTAGLNQTRLISRDPFIIRLGNNVSLTAGVTYSFTLTNITNPPRPGLTDPVALRTYAPNGTLLDGNDNVTRFDLMAILISVRRVVLFEGSSTYFLLVLDSPPSNRTNTISVLLQSTNVTYATAQPSMVTFNISNWNVPQQVKVEAPHNFIDEADTALTIITTVVTTDPRWRTLGQDLDDVDVLVMDIDTSGLFIAPTSVTTTEAGGGATFGIQLTSKPLSMVTIFIRSTDPHQVQVDPGTQTIVFFSNDWNISKNVSVFGLDNLVADGNHLVPLEIFAISSDSKYSTLPVYYVNATNLDDDVAGFLLQPISAIIYEDPDLSNTAAFQVSLLSQPLSTISVQVASLDPAVSTVFPSTLYFDPSNWNISQSFQVTSIDDMKETGNVTYQVQVLVTDGDTFYLGANASVLVTNIDDDIAAVEWSPNITETVFQTQEVGDTQDPSVFFRLLTCPLSEVTAVFTPSDPTQGIVQPSRVTISPYYWELYYNVIIIGIDDSLADTDHEFTINVTFVTEDPFYGALTYTINVINIARKAPIDTANTQLLALCIATPLEDFDPLYFRETMASLFNVTINQVNLDSYRACTTLSLAGVDPSEWYWIKFKPQSLVPGTSVWFNFIELPMTTNLEQLVTDVLNLLNQNAYFRQILGATGVATVARKDQAQPRSVFYDGCPRTIRRYFSVVVSVIDDGGPYSPISPVVWAVRSPDNTNPIWMTEQYASDQYQHPHDGLRTLAEAGNISAIMQELSEKHAQGYVEAFGAGSADPRQLVEITKGQSAKFGFYASPGDHLVLAAKMSRTNDRFLGTDEWGKDLFDDRCNPEWGSEIEMFLWDAGTAKDQPFWANLYLGKDSRQLYGGSYDLGQDPDYQMVRKLAESELNSTQDEYPLPRRLLKVVLEPGLDVILSPQINSYKGGIANVQVSFPPDLFLGNELRIAFPQGWFRFNANGIPTKATILSGMDTMPSLPNTTTEGDLVIIQFNTTIVLTDRTVLLVVDNLEFPPVCGELEYRVTAHDCKMHDVHNAGKYIYRVCGSALTTIISVPPNGLPRGCDACHSCVFDLTLDGQDRFTCWTPDGRPFLRVAPLEPNCTDGL